MNSRPPAPKPPGAVYVTYTSSPRAIMLALGSWSSTILTRSLLSIEALAMSTSLARPDAVTLNIVASNTRGWPGGSQFSHTFLGNTTLMLKPLASTSMELGSVGEVADDGISTAIRTLIIAVTAISTRAIGTRYVRPPWRSWCRAFFIINDDANRSVTTDDDFFVLASLLPRNGCRTSRKRYITDTRGCRKSLRRQLCRSARHGSGGSITGHMATK